jgi:hypothetical protein
MTSFLYSSIIKQSPFELNKPIVEQNFVLGQPLRPARKRAGSRSRGTYEARGAARNFRTGVGSSTLHTAASRRPALSSGEANGWFLAKDLRMAGPGNDPVQVFATLPDLH